MGVLLAAEREAAADLSHQLRTPLTALRLDAEGLASSHDRARIASDVDRLEQVVTRAIQQSRDSSRRQGQRVPGGSCDLGQVVRNRLGFWSILAREQGWEWSLDVPDGRQPIGVSEEELDVCLDALLNNVFTHTPAGASFSVEVVPGPSREWKLVVQGAGPGLPGNALPPRGASGARARAWGWTSCGVPPRRPAAGCRRDGPGPVAPASRCRSARRACVARTQWPAGSS